MLPILFTFLLACCASWGAMLSSLFFVLPVAYFCLLLALAAERVAFSRSGETPLFGWLGLANGAAVEFGIVQDLAAIEFSLILVFLSLCIQLYAFVYFKKDPELTRFSLLLGFFIFFMLLMINTAS